MFQITENLQKEIDILITRYPSKEAAIIPTLHLLRREVLEISDEAMEFVAKTLEVPTVQIKGIVSFYPMFQIKTFGKYIIQVCSTLSCSLLGSGHIVGYLEKTLKIDVGQTTSDKRFTLLKSECLASCGTAPVMQINEMYYEDLTEAKIDRILKELRQP